VNVVVARDLSKTYQNGFNLIPVLYRIIALMKEMRDESGTTYGSDHCPATCIGDAS
jgi:predicted Zn-dependent protease